jgi:hypothetical protein
MGWVGSIPGKSWVGLGWVDLLVGWVGLGYMKLTHELPWTRRDNSRERRGYGPGLINV